MNSALKWKLIAGFILAFVAGGITGAAVGGMHARHVFFEFHHPELIGVRMMEQFRSELNLTPEQVAKISPILYKTAAEPQKVRPEVSQEVLAEMIGTTRSRVNFFMNKFRKLGFIRYNGGLQVNSSLLSVVLHE